jgi:TonB family protein
MISTSDTLLIAAVPVIATENLVQVQGAPIPVDGSAVGNGSGSGSGGGNGPGQGPGSGPGVGDVYESGVGGVSAPVLVHEVKPNFTVEAMRARIQGVVVMDVIVRADGTVDPASIRVTRSLDRGLDEQAIIAVRQWRFRPSSRLGRPVASRALVELAFSLR